MINDKITENKTGRRHRNFGSGRIYLPNGDPEGGDNKFRFKNSLIITPNYELEFESTGGIKYIKNHEDCVFFSGGGISAQTNGVQKLPVMLRRGINKLSGQKKMIVEEKYNYEEKYEIHQNIILYYEENRIDFQIAFVKNMQLETKDITSSFALDFYLPETSGGLEYKKFAEKAEHSRPFERADGLEYIYIDCKSHGMTVYPERGQMIARKDKSLIFSVDNPLSLEKNYINVKFYLEKYKLV